MGTGIYTKRYEQFHTENVFVLLHRLLAVSEYGFEAVVDNHVHHENEIQWDNRIDNIQILSPAEHTSLHLSDIETTGGGVDPISLERCESIRNQYGEKTIKELSDEHNMSKSGIHDHLSGECPHFDESVTKGQEGPRDGPWRDYSTFSELYCYRGMTLRELAEEWGCSESTASNWKRRHDLAQS